MKVCGKDAFLFKDDSRQSNLLKVISLLLNLHLYNSELNEPFPFLKTSQLSRENHKDEKLYS